MGVPAAAGILASGRSPYERDQANGVVQGEISAVGPGKPFSFYGTLNLAIWAEFATTLTTVADDLSASVAAAGAIAAGAAINSARVPPGTTVQSIVGTALELALPTLTFRGKVVDDVAAITDILDTTWLLGSTVSGFGLTGSETVDAITTASVAPNSANNYPGIKGEVELSDAASATPVNVNPVEPYEFALAPDTIGSGAADAVFTGAAIGMTGAAQLERSFDGGATWLVCNVGGLGVLAQWNTTSPVSLAFGEPEKGVLYRLNCTALSAAAGYSLHYRLSATGQAATTLSVQTL